MSDASLRLIPVHPWYVPAEPDVARARAFLAQRFHGAQALIVTVHEKPQFIDGGSNFGEIWCPETGQPLSLEWWQGAMDGAWDEDGFGTLEAVLPTTGNRVSLNDLCYEWPVGFARFVLEVEADAHRHDMDCIDLRRLGCLLRTSMRIIWRHG